jgi:arylformamidase
MIEQRHSMNRKIYDISPPITTGLKVWPGDTPPNREVFLDMKRGDHLTLSTFRSTVHVGAHVDGANHYGRDEPGVDGWGLDRFLGPAQVIRLKVKKGTRVSPGDLTVPITQERVLLATSTYPDPNVFTEDFASLHPDLIDHLGGQGVKLVGVDVPSVDAFTSKDLPTHHRFLANDMTILEGLVLSDVPAGTYELIALPLKLVDFDASPVRAVLREINQG